MPDEQWTRKVKRGMSIDISSMAWIVTCLGLRSTSTFLRASLYSRSPPTLAAENMGGICSISPSNGTSAARIAASSMPSTGASAVTSPVGSMVSVVTPSRATPS